MDPPGSSADGSPSPTRRQLQGPRPPQLRVRKDSYVIQKPPVPHPPNHPPAPPKPPPQMSEATADNRQPVIIYAVSPKVIHATVSDFMSVVQRLTAASPTAGDQSAAGDISPAAKLASIERTTTPKDRDKVREINNNYMGMVEGLELGQIPGILSPAPATLPPIPPGFFSPGSDPHGSLLQDLSPWIQGNIFIPSPSTLFSAPMVSPSPSSFDLNPFFDF